LIEQVQYTSLQAVTATQQQVNIETDFNHPIKEFFFVARRDKMNQTHEYFNYSSLATYETLPAGLIPFFTPSQVRTDLIATAKLQLDGYDRFQDRDAPYFRLVQPYEHHTFTPVERYIYCYSLALNPEQIQPSGSLNASRIDSVNWQIVMNPLLSVPEGTVDSVSRGPCTIRIYAVNYNVLRVVGGYAGVLFTI
jgi:hypothetical protein